MAIGGVSSKSGPKSVPMSTKPSWVLGSRPPGLRAPRIKPVNGQTMYGKSAGPRQANLAGSSFGDTGDEGLS